VEDQPSPSTLRRLRDIVGDLFAIAVRLARARLGGAPSAGTMCIVVDDRDRVLLVRASYRRTWGFPGGFLDPREDPIVGAIREVREETGASVHNVVLVRKRTRGSHSDYLLIGVTDVSQSGTASTAWEIAASGWFPIDQLPQLHAISQSVLDLESDGLRGVILRYRTSTNATLLDATTMDAS
jgi:ADP-ribose pyrophosphatase YjhB (NUDIX family)